MPGSYRGRARDSVIRVLSPGIPRLPFVPDPLRRIKVPKDLEPLTSVADEVDPADGGMTRDSVEAIWAAVERLYRSGVHPAITVCVRREGAVVLDRAIGHERGNGPGDPDDAVRVPARPETPFTIYSASKAIAATVAHILDGEGAIHLGDRVSEYIPEYARHGKDAITIAHVLSHRAGVANLPPEALDLDMAGDLDRICEIICDAKPASRPGKMLAYHAISGGFIIGEIVRRVTGKDIRAVLAERVLDPLGFRWTNFGVAPEHVPLVAVNYPTGAPVVPPLSNLLERALGNPPDEVTRISNDPRFLTAIIPSANTVTTANELSRFFELLRRGGELDGVRVLEPRTIRRALTEQSYREVDFTLGFPARYGLGFILWAKLLSLYGPDTELAFGHLGFTNILGWADPERAISAALITSGKPVLYPELANLWALTRRIGAEAPKTSESALAFPATA
jgi:CubicO group peptidase (beta-lactamase class C family)